MISSRLRLTVLSSVVSFALIGCAVTPIDQPIKAEHATVIQPVALQIGIAQPEIYAAFVPSAAGASAAASCGAIPGIGVLLAGLCGGTMGAIDATANASRAKTADEQVRPLKDATLDVKFDQIYSEAFAKSLTSVAKLQFSGSNTTKTVDPKAYDEIYRLSSANSVMFLNVDYHISTDFSTLEVTANGHIVPRSAAARTAAGMPPVLPEKDKGQAYAPKDAVYQVNLAYHGKLPTKAANPAEYIDIWKSDNAQILRTAVNDSAIQLARFLSEDIQRGPNSVRPVLRKADPSKGQTGDVVAENAGGELLRLPNGALIYKTTLTKSGGLPNNVMSKSGADLSAGTAVAK